MSKIKGLVIDLIISGLKDLKDELTYEEVEALSKVLMDIMRRIEEDN